MNSMREMMEMMRTVKIIAVLLVLSAPWMLDLSKSSSVAADSEKGAVSGAIKPDLDAECSSEQAEAPTPTSEWTQRRPRFLRANRANWQWRLDDEWDRETPDEPSRKWEMARMLFHIVFDHNNRMMSEAIRQFNTRLILSSLSMG